MVANYGVQTGSSLLDLIAQAGLMGPLVTDPALAQLAYMQSLGQLSGQGIYSGLGTGPTLQQQQISNSAQQFAMQQELERQRLTQEAALAREQLAQLSQSSQADIELRRMLGLSELDLGRADLALQGELGRGDLALRGELGRGDLALRGELGRRGLDLDERALSENTRLTERSQALQGQQMLAARATRQLAAPGGNVVPTLQPILGRSRI